MAGQGLGLTVGVAAKAGCCGSSGGWDWVSQRRWRQVVGLLWLMVDGTGRQCLVWGY